MVTQVVVPKDFRVQVPGVWLMTTVCVENIENKKTYHRVLRFFFLAGVEG